MRFYRFQDWTGPKVFECLTLNSLELRFEHFEEFTGLQNVKNLKKKKKLDSFLNYLNYNYACKCNHNVNDNSFLKK